MQQDLILILDFGSQYTQLIARRIRELGVYCEIYAYDQAAEAIKTLHPKGVILSGSYTSVYDSSAAAPDLLFSLNIPILGICYGMQTLAQQLGGQVINGTHKEFGKAILTKLTDSVLLAGTPSSQSVWMSHGDQVSQLPSQFKAIASSESTAIAAFAHEEKPWFGVQFHPEVTHTEYGHIMLENFVLRICAARQAWQAENILADLITKIRQQVGHDQVVLGLSGGVDSSVLAALLHQAISKQLTCIFVDTGLLRLHEQAKVKALFQTQFPDLKVQYVNAEDEFLQALAGVTDPEAKRKIIGHHFITIFEREAKKLPGVQWLAQGTIYPDVIESGAIGKAQVIKSHHNVGGLPERLNLKLLEPLKTLFKDEVITLGQLLNLPSTWLKRHPFPGPGLAVRILGEVKAAYLESLRQADAIYMAELEAADYYHKIAQAFAVFLPVKSVAVMGDGRKYEYVIALRAVETTDFMTAHNARLPYDLIEQIANRIVNEVPHVSRVVYDVTSKPPATIEWE